MINKIGVAFFVFLFNFKQISTAQETNNSTDSLHKEEKVTLGYITTQKHLVANAISSLNEKEFNQGLILSPEQLFQGRVAGVQTALNDGNKSSEMTTLIRGLTSLNNAAPLYVVDGIPLLNETLSSSQESNNPLRFLNTADIERIDIVKDGATAIYGVRASSGIVFIQTKKGNGKGKLNYDYALSSSAITKKYDLLSASEYNLATKNMYNFKGETDWQDEVLSNALTHNHNLSYGLGNDKNNLKVSLNYLNQKGIITNTGFKRYNAHVNGKVSLFKNYLELSVNSIFSDMNNQNIDENLIGGVVSFNPTKKAKDNLGNYYTSDVFSTNPSALLEYAVNQTKGWRGVNSMQAKVTIWDGISIVSRYSLDYSKMNYDLAYSNLLNLNGNNQKGMLVHSDTENENRISELFLNVDKNIEGIGYQFIGGIFIQHSLANAHDYQAVDFSTSNLQEMISNPLLGLNKVNSTASKEVTNGAVYFQGNFNYLERYVVSGAFRRETFVAQTFHQSKNAAFRWNIDKEAFFTKNICSQAAIKVSYGVSSLNGVQNQSTFISDDFTNFKSLKHTNIGLILGFFNNRIQTSLDFYDKKTKNPIMLVYATQPSPFPFQLRQLEGVVSSKGYETTLNIVPIQTKNFTWTLQSNFSLNRNWLSGFNSLIDNGLISGPGLSGALCQRLSGDQIPYTFFVRKFDRFDQDGNSVYIDGDIQQFLDGISPFASEITNLTNQIQYKNFDFSFRLNDVRGNYIYNNTANAYFTKNALLNGRNTTKEVVNNGEASFNAPDVSTRFLEDGSFLKLSNISLAYTWKPKTHISVRFFLVGQNVWTNTKYSGQDPEFIKYKYNYGVDLTRYPAEKTVTFGASLTL